MMHLTSALKGFAIDATDGPIGTLVDFLFDDASWKVRWLVVDCGTWRSGHKVLIHPSAVLAIDFEGQSFEVDLTKSQVEASPEAFETLPVSHRVEARLYEHYGWDPLWNGPYALGDSGAMTSPLMAAPYFGFGETPGETEPAEASSGDNLSLRSVVDLVGHRIEARDGTIGQIENLMLDGENWALRFLIADSGAWWFGAKVLIAPASVRQIDETGRALVVDASLSDVKTSPVWDPMAAFNETEAKRLLHHYTPAGAAIGPH